MEHLCGCFEPQSFSGSVIQSVLNHSNFLITNRRHGSLLWNVLAQQPIKVLIAASLPTGKWSCKVSGGVELLINQSVRCKLFSIVIGQSLDPDGEGLEVAHYG